MVSGRYAYMKKDGRLVQGSVGIVRLDPASGMPVFYAAKGPADGMLVAWGDLKRLPEFKASDIPDQVVIAFVRLGISSLSQIQEALQHYPAKVVSAKIRNMVKSGKLFCNTDGAEGIFKEGVGIRPAMICQEHYQNVQNHNQG